MSDTPSIVAVTGAAGYIGTRLLQELEEIKELERIVAIDIKPLVRPVHNASSHRADVTQPLDDLFKETGVDTIIHLAFLMRPARSLRELRRATEINVGGTENLLKSARACGVKNIVYLSSHTVYGARRDNPIPITEEAPLRPNLAFQYARHKSLCEELLRRFAQENPQVRVIILRSCVVMGSAASNYVTQAFFKPILMGVWGSDPPLQFVHEDDLARLIALLVREPRAGIFNVAGSRVIRYSRMAELARKPLLFLPPAVAYRLTQWTWNLGLQKDSPAVGLDFVRYPIVLSTGRVRGETGFRFRYTSEDAHMAFLSASHR